MTHAENKVEWCLKKAEKDLGDGLHRGLIKVNPSVVLAQKHLEKAEHNLKAAQFFNDNNYSDWSASGFFYCIYHGLLAIIRKNGYESRNQECTLAVVEMLIENGTIALDKKFLNMLNIAKAKDLEHSLIKVREEFQYGTDTSYKEIEEFEYFVKICQEMINLAKGIIISGEQKENNKDRQ